LIGSFEVELPIQNSARRNSGQVAVLLLQEALDNGLEARMMPRETQSTKRLQYKKRRSGEFPMLEACRLPLVSQHMVQHLQNAPSCD
jgi:hypothetical protein